MSDRSAKRFLRLVWSQQYQARPHHAFLSAKDWDSGSWSDHPQTGPVVLPSLDDLYFAPCFFSAPNRQRDNALPGKWLYADLDEVVPGKLPDRLSPTVAWETSPGRFQCLWLLERPLRPPQLEALNQKLTYYTGADKGGWSVTKVLRVPGSYNNKRGDRELVRLLWTDGPIYSASSIYDLVRDVRVGEAGKVGDGGDRPDLVLPKANAARLYKRHRSKLTIETRRLLKEEVPQGSRSEALYKLERLLVEAGLPLGAVFVLAKAAPCNKYKGQQREDQQLWKEIQRAASSAGQPKSSSSTPRQKVSSRRERSGDTSGKPSTPRRRLTSYSDFVEKKLRKPSWMVEGIWSESAHGVVAGDPKTFKSVLSTDLAISVASGTKFLDHFPVPQQGPVILIQKENDEGEVQDRVQRIAYSKQLTASAKVRRNVLTYNPGADLPLHLMNNEDFDLTDEDDMRWLRRRVRKLNPVLLILDPFYLLAPGVDENSAHAVAPVMERLLRLKQRNNCGTLIIHHFKKQNQENPVHGAPRISGSGVFHRWYESALLLDRPDLGEPEVRITPEHRSHSPQGVIWAEFDLGTDEDLHYSVDIRRPKEQAAHDYDTLRELVENSGGKVTMTQVMAALGVNREAAKRKIQKAGGLQIRDGKANGKRALYVVKEDHR